MVEARVNGKGPFRFILDFGSNVISVKKSVASALGATVLQERNGRQLLHLDSLELGEAVFEDVVARTDPEGLDGDGVLGFGLFREGLVTLDYPQRRLVLSKGSLPPVDGQEVLAYELVERMPHLPVSVGGETFLFNFDTGAGNTWLSLPQHMATRLELVRPAVPGPLISNTGDDWVRRVQVGRAARDFTFGAHVVSRPRVHFVPDEDDPNGGYFLMGDLLLREFTLTFDLHHQRVRMERPRGTPIEVPPLRTAGVRMERSAGKWRITDVIPGTPAERLGVRTGAELLSAGDTPASELSDTGWKALVDTQPSVVLTLRQEEGERTFELPIVALGE
jgi:hypothetical protein